MRERQWMIKIIYCLSSVAFLFTHCDARKSLLISNNVVSRHKDNHPSVKHLKILDVAKNLNMLIDVSMKDSSNPEPFVSSPFTLPPYDSLAPIPFPDTNNNPPYCVYPPPQSPSTTMPSPLGFSPTPPFTTTSPNAPLLSPPPGPDEAAPNPPSFVPSPIFPVPNPPYYEPSPPSGIIVPSPPEYVPSPIGYAPGPPVFQPPVVYPPPTVPPPPATGFGGGGSRVWCVAKPSVPDPILQEAMNYACGSGANCDPLQPNGSCYQPNTPLAHASYAFNSYWQRTKVGGGTCDFGGTAILVTMDPSSAGCKFVSL